jgi:radical SAM protein with 4Fe4S-binding SPASM domain
MLEFLKKNLFKEAETSESYKPLNAQQYAAYNRYRPGGPKPVFCYLPFNSLTFSMSGRVYVCNYNKNILLGKYPENTIQQIWESDNAKKLREHLRHNDLEFGCNHCKFYFDKGKFTNLRPLAFDKYSQHTTADFPRVMEFELSNECNLECQMCNGNVSSSIRKRKDKLPPLPNPYDDAFVQQLVPYLPHLKEAKFYGGEPFLIPVYFQVWDKLAEVNPGCNIFLITNGTHWNNKIKSLVEKLNLDVAISIDSLQKERLEKIRQNAVFEKLMENIERFNGAMEAKGKTLSLSFTVQQENWQELPDFIRFCNNIKAQVYVSYLDSPKEFAISELSKDELEKIKQTLLIEVFPETTALEKHNAQCLKDFLTYVQKYIDNENEPQYEDYFYLPENLTEEEKQMLKGQQLIRVPGPATRDEVYTAMKDFTQHNKRYADTNCDSLMRVIDEVYASFNPDLHPKLYAMILLSDMGNAIQTISTKTVEELKETTKEQLPLVVYD